jgi:squalene-hopene/tetraprenyl-beta-curcumene cyclase
LTAVASTPDSLVARARRTTERATDYLLSLQDETGWWKGNLQTNVTMDAEDLMLRQFLGLLTEEITVPAARWIRSEQRADGTWSNFHDGPADLSTTIEAYVGLRLAGDSIDEPHMLAAREYIVDNGGIENSRVFTRIWLALFGEWSWDELPVMPPELIFLPAGGPGSASRCCPSPTRSSNWTRCCTATRSCRSSRCARWR